MMPALRARGLTKTFRDGEREVTVLRGVDLTLARDDFVALLGPSGSGKSTLLSILGTLLRPSGGELEVGGEWAVDLDERALVALRNRRIGFVFQFHHLLPDLTAQENVALPSAGMHGRLTSQALRRAGELLDRVGLSERRSYKPARLSGGQKQRVAIARALMNEPAVVLADEPTGSLDGESAERVLDLLAEVASSERTAFLISTHDPHVAATCARRIVMRDGLAHDEGNGQREITR